MRRAVPSACQISSTSAARWRTAVATLPGSACRTLPVMRPATDVQEGAHLQAQRLCPRGDERRVHFQPHTHGPRDALPHAQTCVSPVRGLEAQRASIHASYSPASSSLRLCSCDASSRSHDAVKWSTSSAAPRGSRPEGSTAQTTRARQPTASARAPTAAADRPRSCAAARSASSVQPCTRVSVMRPAARCTQGGERTSAPTCGSAAASSCWRRSTSSKLCCSLAGSLSGAEAKGAQNARGRTADCAAGAAKYPWARSKCVEACAQRRSAVGRRSGGAS